jgi:hypothetical protein
VVLSGGRVDAAATARLRATMPAPDPSGFDFGERRAEMERRWPPAIQEAALRLLESVPAAVRDWGKHQIYERIQAVAAARPPVPADVDAAWADIRARLTRALGET